MATKDWDLIKAQEKLIYEVLSRVVEHQANKFKNFK